MNERYAKCISFDKNVKGRIGGAYSGGYPFSISGDIRSLPS